MKGGRRDADDLMDGVTETKKDGLAARTQDRRSSRAAFGSVINNVPLHRGSVRPKWKFRIKLKSETLTSTHFLCSDGLASHVRGRAPASEKNIATVKAATSGVRPRRAADHPPRALRLWKLKVAGHLQSLLPLDGPSRGSIGQTLCL